MAESKPSESLFVRSILPHCKRIGPMWLKNVTNLRQKCREYTSQNTTKNCVTFMKVDNKNLTKQLNEEINIVVNLLRKLYREILPQSIMNLIKCWLNFPEFTGDNSCILTKGDCRGRMKRIDGGKGADKVWRLDTIVGIMFHGLPLTSADSNMIYHTCQHDLCIRPQHLRFKAASVSLVLVLKALEQTGYSIKFDDVNKDRFDEFVDISGPFGILELEALRHELVKVTQVNSYKLACSPDDIFILHENPLLKQYYLKNTPTSSPIDIILRSNSEEIKQRLLTRISENSKCKNLEFVSPNEAKFVEELENISPLPVLPAVVDSLMRASSKRKGTHVFDTEYLLDPKRQKRSPSSSESIENNEIEDNELIEIMETRHQAIRKSKFDSINCLFSNISDDSPLKMNLDNFIRIPTRSASGSMFESLDKKRSSQFSVCCYSQMKRNSGDDSRLDEYRTSEFLDMLHSMRHQYHATSSLKMTPNIFSPVSEIEES